MNDIEKSNKKALLYSQSESIEIAKQKLELAEKQDERLYTLASKEQDEKHLQIRREWIFLYIILSLIVVAIISLFFFTGREYLADAVKIILAFISGLSLGKFKLFSK